MQSKEERVVSETGGENGCLVKYYNVRDVYPVKIPTLTKGTVLVLYTDSGPSGICGQSMRITCPHAALLIFPNLNEAKRYLDNNPMRNGKSAYTRWFVVGEGGDGELSIFVHNGGVS